MSLGNKSSSSNRQTYNTTTKNLNIQGVEGMVLAGNEKSTINITDGGAIEKMADIQKASLTFAERTNSKAIDAQKASLVFAERASRNALDFAYQAGRPDAANAKTLILAVAGVAGAGLLIVFMVKKK